MLQTSHSPPDPSAVAGSPRVGSVVEYYFARVVIVAVGVVIGLIAGVIAALWLGWFEINLC
jgi:hypothetical protein